MNWNEHALRFACRDCWLYGVLHLPEQAGARGVLVVTGGPQYRAGSHRQFVLLGRYLAATGMPVMRFDYRGMGDSEGDRRDFEHIGDDLSAAIAHFLAAVPALKEIVLWGLCDGATAAAFHAARDRRVAGLILLNPWVRTEQNLARATLRHYYLRRLLSADFWRKLAAGSFRPGRALADLKQLAGAARALPAGGSGNTAVVAMDAARTTGETAPGSLPQRLFEALRRYRGRVLIILSGADLGAREFSALPGSDAAWRALLAEARVTQVTVARANHTFASQDWRDEVAATCRAWMAAW